MSVFSQVKIGFAPREGHNLHEAYMQDADPKKVDLSIGVYRTEEQQPWVLPVVRKAEKIIAADESYTHEYFPIVGCDIFSDAATLLLLGPESKALADGRVLDVQCLSGTGALRVALEFLASVMKLSTVYVSEQTWENYSLLSDKAGFNNYRTYRYWDAARKDLDFAGLLADLREASEKSVIILQVCAHNPTGVDPTQEQWQQIAEVVREKGLFTLFDLAYHGFASGDLDRDAYAVRLWDSLGLESFTAQSFAKNFGIYNQRIGNLVLVLNDKKVKEAVRSQTAVIIRAIYSNPPARGARIVARTLTNSAMRKEWQSSVKVMADRMLQMRTILKQKLDKVAPQHDWSHLRRQTGMFGFTGLSEAQTRYLKEKHHIYMLKNGRINLCGLTNTNVDNVAQAFADAIASVK